jgi:hypothetical protein
MKQLLKGITQMAPVFLAKLMLNQCWKIVVGFWWGRPELNRRPLPNDGAKPPFTGFFMTAPEIRHSPRGVSKPVCVCFLEPVVIPA